MEFKNPFFSVENIVHTYTEMYTDSFNAIQAAHAQALKHEQAFDRLTARLIEDRPLNERVVEMITERAFFYMHMAINHADAAVRLGTVEY